MAKPVVEVLPDNRATVWFKQFRWERGIDGRWRAVRWQEGEREFRRVSGGWTDLLEMACDEGTRVKRYPRTEPDEVENFKGIPLTDQFKNVSTGWVVDGLFPQGSLVLLSGLPSAYKTWFSLAVGGAVSEGREFLGRKTVRTPVLYLNRENPLSVILGRKRILRLPEGKRLKIWGNWMKDPPPLIGDPRLTEIARDIRPLMVFDSLVRFHTADENSAKQMAAVFEQLRPIADAGGTVLLLHHQGKSRTSLYRGSSDILAGVDAAFELREEKKQHGTTLILECFKHRFIEEPKVLLRPDLKHGRFEVIEGQANADTSNTIAKVKAAIARKPGMNQEELLQQAVLPETKGAELLNQYEGEHWFSERGKGKSLRYYLEAPSAS